MAQDIVHVPGQRLALLGHDQLLPQHPRAVLLGDGEPHGDDDQQCGTQGQGRPQEVRWSGPPQTHGPEKDHDDGRTCQPGAQRMGEQPDGGEVRCCGQDAIGGGGDSQADQAGQPHAVQDGVHPQRPAQEGLGLHERGEIERGEPTESGEAQDLQRDRDIAAEDPEHREGQEHQPDPGVHHHLTDAGARRTGGSRRSLRGGAHALTRGGWCGGRPPSRSARRPVSMPPHSTRSGPADQTGVRPGRPRWSPPAAASGPGRPHRRAE